MKEVLCFLLLLNIQAFSQTNHPSYKRNCQENLLTMHLWQEDFSQPQPVVSDGYNSAFFVAADRVDSTNYRSHYLRFNKGGQLIVYKYLYPSERLDTIYTHTDVWKMRWRLRGDEIQIKYKGLKHYSSDSKLIGVSDKTLEIKALGLNHYLSW